MPQALELGLNTFGDITAGSDGRPLSHAQVIRNIVYEATLADEVAVDFFGVGEHHRADFAVAAPEVVLGAITGRTKRIRLGSAVTVLGTDDPVRVFQRFATLNAVASGRAEIILGRGWFTESFRLFGCDLSQYDALFEEKLDLFATLIRQQTVSWQGRLRSPLENEPIFPPVEGKALKTWIGVGATPASVLRAANYDLPMMLAIIGGEPERFRPFVEIYRRACEKLGRPPREVGVHSVGYVANTDAEARSEFWPAYKQLRDRIGVERNWPPIDRSKFEAEVDRGSLYVGSPEFVARKIVKTVKDLGVARFDMRYSVGQLAHERLLRSIELFGSRVIPIVNDMLA